jgi:metal-sulfur cluster biosynthetic enzyme
MNLIALNLELALEEAGFHMPSRITTVLSPAWTTDWMSEEPARPSSKAYGIAPPNGQGRSRRALFGEDEVACPRCGSANTQKRLSEFGSTACKRIVALPGLRRALRLFQVSYEASPMAVALPHADGQQTSGARRPTRCPSPSPCRPRLAEGRLPLSSPAST